jgi:hypothetical protein
MLRFKPSAMALDVATRLTVTRRGDIGGGRSVVAV